MTRTPFTGSLSRTLARLEPNKKEINTRHVFLKQSDTLKHPKNKPCEVSFFMLLFNKLRDMSTLTCGVVFMVIVSPFAGFEHPISTQEHNKTAVQERLYPSLLIYRKLLL